MYMHNHSKYIYMAYTQSHNTCIYIIITHVHTYIVHMYPHAPIHVTHIHTCTYTCITQILTALLDPLPTPPCLINPATVHQPGQTSPSGFISVSCLNTSLYLCEPLWWIVWVSYLISQTIRSFKGTARVPVILNLPQYPMQAMKATGPSKCQIGLILSCLWWQPGAACPLPGFFFFPGFSL